MAYFGLKSQSQPKGPEISENDAFDILCAKCLEMEAHSQQILNVGVAQGWAERMKMLSEKYGWEFRFTIKDK